MTDSLQQIARDLRDAPAAAQRQALEVMEHAAVKVKTGWRDNARQSAGQHARRYPDSISYDMSIGAGLLGHIEFEVGPDKGRPQGALGNVLEFGSVHNPPHNDGGRALEAEAPALETALVEVTLDALGWR